VKTFIIKEVGERYSNITVSTAFDMFREIKGIYENLDDGQEHLVLLCFDSGNKITHYKVLFSGAMDASMVDPKILFRAVLLTNATGIALVHNHPSGRLKPSDSDIKETQKIKKICEMFEIRFIDHLIISKDGYYSMQEHELI